MVRRVHRARRVWAVVAHAARLPFRPTTFARVLVVDALHHFDAQELALAELATVLCQGGRLVIEEPDIERAAIKCLAVGERLLGMRSRFLPAEKLASLLASQGLEVSVVRGRNFALWVNGDKEDSPTKTVPGQVESDRRAVTKNPSGVPTETGVREELPRVSDKSDTLARGRMGRRRLSVSGSEKLA